MRSHIILALVAALLLAPLTVGLPAPAPVPEVAAGFAIEPLAAMPAPTALAFGPGGDLYATLLTGDVVRVPLTWTGAGPIPGPVETVASGFSSPLGIAFAGSTMFIADSHSGFDQWSFGRVTQVEADDTRTVLVDGLPNGRHNTNHLRFAPDGRLAITNGNPNDAGVNGGPPDVFPYTGAILLVDVAEVAADPAVLEYVDGNGDAIAPDDIAAHAVNADFADKVDVLGSGFRNVFGVAFDSEGRAWTGMNGADVPSSQDALYRIEPGVDYGFPFCFNEGDPGAVGDDISVVNNPEYPDADCTTTPPAEALLGWHICATGLDFPTAGMWAFQGEFATSVFVAECGPFFPEPHEKGFSTHDTGHKVARVSLDADGHAVEVHDFVTGLALPTDVLFGPDGAMYIADADGVFRVAPLLPSAAADSTVEVGVAAAGFSFVSPVVVVPQGATVVWNGALLPHTVTTSDTLQAAAAGDANDMRNDDGDPDTFNDGLNMGGTVRHTFTRSGEFPYYCDLHYRLGMVGEVIVV